MTEGPTGEPDFEERLCEALDSLREAYPDTDIADGRPSPESLTGVLSTSTSGSDVREDVARMLSLLAEGFPADLAPVAPALIDQLDRPATDPVRRHLLRALGHVANADPSAVGDRTEPLVVMLESDDTTVVREATWVLSNVAAAEPGTVESAFPTISRLLSHEDREVRRRAAGALAAAPASVLTGDSDLLRRLLELLDAPGVYRTAGRTLVSVAPVYGAALVDGLFERLEDGRPGVREHAAWTLVPLADAHPDLVRPRWPALVEIVGGSDDRRVQNGATAALAAVATDGPEPGILTGLVSLLEHDDEMVRRYGCLALGDVAVETGDVTALRALDAARDDEAHLVSREAETLLASAAREYPDVVSEIKDDVGDRSGDEFESG